MREKKIIILSESVIPSLLNEKDWNYHYLHHGKHDMKPYGSDSKYVMAGRETGHFGSGTYFSSYRNNENLKNLGQDNEDGRFIKIADNVYRVDMDLYKNLYRVWNKRQGDVLYTLLRDMNRFYNRITEFGKFIPKNARYSNSDLYQRMMRNAASLELKLPSYYELTRMAQRHEGDQSFSTLFMEYNGYNGVNVSGVEFYDNTTHGSVIYDLSKVGGEMKVVIPNGLWRLDNDRAYDDSVVYDSIGDYEAIALDGNNSFWWDKINTLPPNRVKRILKNYASTGNILEYFQIDEMDDSLRKWYLRMIFQTDPSDRWGRHAIDELMKDLGRFGDLVSKNDAWYYANYHSKSAFRHASGFNNLLTWYSYNLDWNMSTEEEQADKRKFADKLMQYMTRPLMDDEKEYLEKWLEVDD